MRSLSHLNKYLWKYRSRLILGIIFIIISNLIAIYPAQVIRHGFNLISETLSIYPLYSGLQAQNEIYSKLVLNLSFFGVLVLALAVMKGLFMFFMRQTIIVMSRKIEYDLKNEVYNHYQELSLSFYRKNSTGDLMARISEDVSRVRMYVGPAIMYTLNLATLFILVIFTMVSVNPKLTFLVLTPLPFLVFSIYKVTHLINHRSERVQAKLSDISTFVQEAFSGIRVIKAFGNEKNSIREFEKECEEYNRKSLKLVSLEAMFQPIMMLLIGLSTLLTVYFGGVSAISGEITVGNIAEFIIYVNMLTWPVASLGWVTSLVQRAAASQERINQFLETKPEITSGTKSAKLIEGNVEFSGVSFIYPESGITALDDISFKIRKGKSIAVLGRTGSGKSTVAALLTRMYDPAKGTVIIDETDIREYNIQELREKIGYVPQDVFLFSDTLRNNILFGLSETKEFNQSQKLELASKDAAVYDNIIDFPLGFETKIGERGITLSGGQKQRVSIARAVIRNPSILIFDDCLSAVDTKTEESILQNLSRIMKGKTSLIISHRVSTVKLSDQIIVLDNGKIIEEGDHRSLLKLNGVYTELYQKQISEDPIQQINTVL